MRVEMVEGHSQVLGGEMAMRMKSSPRVGMLLEHSLVGLLHHVKENKECAYKVTLGML